MTVEDLLENNILPLQFADKVSFALGSMDELKLKHLPVVDGDIFRGLVNEGRLTAIDDEESGMDEAGIRPDPVFIGKDRSIHDLLRLMTLGRFTMVPVLDENGLYCGYVTAERLLLELGLLLSADSGGGILELEMAAEDYHLSEIAQILESDGLRALNVCMRPLPESTRVKVLIKTHSRDLSRALHTFARYEYTVRLAEFDDVHDLQLNERYELLMRYLNV